MAKCLPSSGCSRSTTSPDGEFNHLTVNDQPLTIITYMKLQPGICLTLAALVLSSSRPALGAGAGVWLS